MNFIKKNNAQVRRDTYQCNTFLGATFIQGDNTEIKKHPCPNPSDLNNLSCISALYIYTNPAPHGYGSPAPKIAETVIRADSYNLKPEANRTKTINGREVNWPIWETEGDYPFGSIVGNFHPGLSHDMFKEFLKKNIHLIKKHSEKSIEDAISMNSDVLTKGRQTFDCVKERSVTSSKAYQVWSEIIRNN